MGLFILNRFRDITREEVIAMLNFDLMDTVAGRQIYNEGMVDMLTDVLRERFGIVPEDLTREIYAIGRRDIMKRLVMHAVRCENIGDFKKMLAKMRAA
jgi:hypothetical protein